MGSWTLTSTGNGTSLGVSAYARTDFGGAGATDAANPEVGKTDDAQVDLNFFGAGIHAYTKWSGGSDLWTQLGVWVKRDAGPLGPGAPGGLAEVRIKKRFLLAAISDYSGGSAPIIAIAGPGVNPSFGKNILKLVLVSGSGTSSVWRFDADWEEFATGDGQTASSANIPYADLAVDTDRTIVYRVQGCTAAQTDFTGVILDGSILVEMDGVEYINATGIDPYIHWASGNPSVRDTWQNLGFGLAGLLGPIWPISISDASVPDYTPIVDVSDPCCGAGTGQGTFGGGVGVTGDIPVVNQNAPFRPGPAPTECADTFVGETAADLTDAEDWRTLLGPTPDMLCELHATKHPDTLGETVYWWGDKGMDLPIESAFVEGRVRRPGWLEIRRAMALPDQYPEVSRAGVQIDEQDALIRTLLDTDSTSYLVAREWVSWLVSETWRKASGAMRVAFRGVVSALNPGPGRTYTIEAEDQITGPFGIFNLDKLVPQIVMTQAFFPPGTGIPGFGVDDGGLPTAGLHKDLEGKPFPILAGTQSDATYLAADGQSAAKGAVPLIWVRDVNLPSSPTQVWGEFLICLGETDSIPNLYASDCGYEPDGSVADPRRAPKRMLLERVYGVDYLSPDDMFTWTYHTGLATRYIERTEGGQTIRYSAVYFRGPRWDHHVRGLVTITADVCPKGPKTAGPFLLWFNNEHVAKNEGRGYSSGDYGPLAAYASDTTVPYLQPSTYTAFQDYTKDRLGDAVGYVVRGFQLREQIPLRELEHRFMQDYEVSLPFNHHGQKMLRWIDDWADPTVGTPYRERIEIDEPLPPYRDAHDEVQNSDAVLFDRDHDLQVWRREPETFRDENSITAHKGVMHGGKRLADGQTIQPREVWSTSDAPTVRDAVSRRLLRKRKAPRYQPIPSDLAALHDEIGSQVLVSHSRGVGSGGYVARPFYVLEQRHNPNRHQVTLGTLDLSAILAGIGGWTADAAPIWDSATEAERISQGFWAAEAGTIPSGNVPAKEWR